MVRWGGGAEDMARSCSSRRLCVYSQTPTFHLVLGPKARSVVARPLCNREEEPLPGPPTKKETTIFQPASNEIVASSPFPTLSHTPTKNLPAPIQRQITNFPSDSVPLIQKTANWTATGRATA